MNENKELENVNSAFERFWAKEEILLETVYGRDVGILKTHKTLAELSFKTGWLNARTSSLL